VFSNDFFAAIDYEGHNIQNTGIDLTDLGILCNICYQLILSNIYYQLFNQS
jgi:hypothetical protein